MERKSFTFEDSKEFHILHNEKGMTLRKIATLYNTSHNVIKNNLKKHGFPWNSRQFKVNETFFRNLDSLEKLYFLGWIYADGCVFAYEEKKYYGLSIKLQERDQYILEYFKKLLCSASNIKFDFTSGIRYSVFKVGSKKIYNDLLKYGLRPRKTHFIKYPKEIITDHRPFILGIFEGDGSITINEKTKMPSFQITGTKEMMAEIRDILIKEVKLETVTVRKVKNSYTFSYSGTNPVQKIGKWLYSWNPPIFLKRKRDLFEKLYTLPKYGKNFIVYKCPQCGRHKEYEKRKVYQLKNYTFQARFCSLSCSGKFNRRYQLNGHKLTTEMKLALKENVIAPITHYKLTDPINRKFVDYHQE